MRSSLNTRVWLFMHSPMLIYLLNASPYACIWTSAFLLLQVVPLHLASPSRVAPCTRATNQDGPHTTMFYGHQRARWSPQALTSVSRWPSSRCPSHTVAQQLLLSRPPHPLRTPTTGRGLTTGALQPWPRTYVVQYHPESWNNLTFPPPSVSMSEALK